MLPNVTDRIRNVVGDEDKVQQIFAILREAEAHGKSAQSQRQQQGIANAKERGVQFGRPQMKFPRNFSKVYQKQQEGSLTITEASKILNISRQQFYRLRKRHEDGL